jgi:hypothetical protein
MFKVRSAARVAALFFGTILASNATMAQSGEFAKKLIGSWTLTSTDDFYEDGRKVNRWGANVTGSAIFDETGHFNLIIMGDDLPVKSATPNFSSKMVIAYFGTYTVDESEKTVSYKIQKSTHPAFDGITRLVKVQSLTDMELTQTTAPIKAPDGTFTPHQVFKRTN